ncbi:MAG: ComEC family competence protein [Bacteroidetes bacterium]|nr:ComEC family competence protein [Bacteroidota bacterium]
MIIIILAITIIFLKREPSKQSILLYLLLFIVGFTSNRKISKELPITQEVHAIATIINTPVEKEKTYQFEAQLQYYDSLENYITTQAILYIKKDSAAQALGKGDKIRVNAKLSPFTESELPGQFDYRSFMASKGIYSSAYVDSKKWVFIAHPTKQLSVAQFSATTRNHFTVIIDKYISEEAGGLIKAISLGVKTDLDKTTKDSFSKAGIMHILAVSGLHVGIVWSLIAFLFKPILQYQPKLKFYVVLVEILLVWLFAVITGFSPSVQRAAFMFSLFSISKLNNLDKDNLNILAASAAILLIINSKMLFSIGFQLSYSAVAAILILYPKIYKTLYFKNKILNYCWSIQAVSFAAVIGTTPITLYYFHQFSLVFPITNLLAIPIAFLLVSGTLLLFSFSSVPFVAYWMGKGISLIAIFLIRSIDIITQWKLASINNLYLDGIEAAGMILILVAMTFALYNVKVAKKAIILTLICINIIFIYRGSRKITVYSKSASIALKSDRYYDHCLTVGNKVFTFSQSEAPKSNTTYLSGFFKKGLLYKHEHLTTPFEVFQERNSIIHTQLASCELSFD